MADSENNGSEIESETLTFKGGYPGSVRVIGLECRMGKSSSRPFLI